ncbi:hypothetical protein BN9982_2420002 [Mycobacterium tuberculosis]|nr:hypothetical protein BN9982_2420002 [Mycobacterium tuberculosis]
MFTSWHRKFTCGNATVTAFDRVCGPLEILGVERAPRASNSAGRVALTSVFIGPPTGLGMKSCRR